jgi:precorrin-6A/cobalt-precorrin-6A reductase
MRERVAEGGSRWIVLWIIGGTGEAVELATAAAAAGIPCLVTVTTVAARAAYPESALLRVWVGPLTANALEPFLGAQGVGAVLDASHPFAVEISRGAIAAAKALGLPYWRFERPGLAPAPSPQVHTVAGLEAVLRPEMLVGQRVLLTLGYRWLHRFAPWQGQATVFARILPSPVALAAALAAGFGPDRIIALRPPISPSLERALWQQWQITRVITKASGAPGGEDTKRAIAEELGVDLIVINRPRLDYPVVYHHPAEALAACQHWWRSGPGAQQ